jgi:hypothetical protein
VSGTDLVEYTCFAPVTQSSIANKPSSGGASYTVSIADSSNTATATTSVVNGLTVGNQITVTGVTGDPDLNGTYIILTTPSPTTFTFTSASVTDATYNNAGITVTSAAPRTAAPIWSIKRNYYGGGVSTTLITAEKWAVKSGSSQSSSSQQLVCDDRATLAYQ